MLDDWHINWELTYLPPEVWNLLKANRLFAMIIPRRIRWSWLSAYAHSEVIRKVVVALDQRCRHRHGANSLGPGELLLQFGTKAQQDHPVAPPCTGRRNPLLRTD